jgi:hypothetical protein
MRWSSSLSVVENSAEPQAQPGSHPWTANLESHKRPYAKEMPMSRIRILTICIAVAICTVSFWTQPLKAQSPLIYLDVEEEIARPGNLIEVKIYMQNLGDSIRAFQIGLTLDRPDIMEFNADTAIQTCYECSDSACTSVVAYPCTVEVVPATAEGTLADTWEYVEARTTGSHDLRITGIADIDLDESPGPITPFTNGILIKVIGEVNCEIADTLTNRTVIANISPINTFFSNSSGELINPLDFTEGSVTISWTNRGDMDGNGFYDPLDLGVMIDLLFDNGDGPCPAYVADLNCDGFPDPLDLGWLIDLLFAQGPPSPCNYEP